MFIVPPSRLAFDDAPVAAPSLLLRRLVEPGVLVTAG